MVTQTAYGLSTRLSVAHEEALKEQDFGVLTEIEVKTTLREKLQGDFGKYDIIGACNPPLAHRALQAEMEVSLLLPCNVVVHEDGEGSVVAAFNPEAAMGLAANPALEEIAREAKHRLKRALERAPKR